MKELKQKMAPFIKRLNKMDAESVFAIAGVIVLFSLFLHWTNVIYVSSGVVIGLAIKRHIS